MKHVPAFIAAVLLVVYFLPFFHAYACLVPLYGGMMA